jgi:hypothetical protein
MQDQAGEFRHAARNARRIHSVLPGFLVLCERLARTCQSKAILQPVERYLEGNTAS